MATTDTSERGFETLIVRALTGLPPRDSSAPPGVREEAAYGGAGYVEGDPRDFDRDVALDTYQLFDFLARTQGTELAKLGIDGEGLKRRQFLHRLQGEITRRGVVDVLRKGVKHGPGELQLFYGTPTPGNARAAERHAANVFSVTRQVRYSKDETQLALDLALFVNGLPVATFELKNRLTKQTVMDAVTQYQRDRDPRELLFQFGRCLVHFALDDQEVRFCTHLTGRSSWFLPFNRGWNDGAGNPPVEGGRGIKTDYLWRDILSRESLTDIIENYAQIVEKDDERGRKKREQVFPRYHQLDVVRRLVADVKQNPVGQKYLIQHSAGSGKSNSIAWLAYRLVGLTPTGQPGEPEVFDSIVVVTDRKNLDKQITRTLKGFSQNAAVLGHSAHSSDLRKFLTGGKKIIVTTVQKFPFILDELGDGHRDRRYALIIDEAHSSQGGRTAGKVNQALSARRAGEAEDDPDAPEMNSEDFVEQEVARRIVQHRMPANVSYFAFTATPKNKTLELFGIPVPEGEKIKHRAFHTYSMKQAVQEGFILDVLKSYTPVASYYNLTKTVRDDPAFDKKRALKKLSAYVHSDRHVIRKKAEIMVDHFLEQVIARRKVGGQARGMVVTASRERARDYFRAIGAYLQELKSPYKALVAFSGELVEPDGCKVSEADLNGIPSTKLEATFKTDPYRLLVVANKFTTSFDEPLLHTMYVDKTLEGIQAVQTLSRLNRAHPQKHDTFVLDFVNDQAERVKEAFQRYYRTTLLADETDPDKLHTLKDQLDAVQVYAWEDVETLVERYLTGADRDRLDPILEACVATYQQSLDEDEQVRFKGDAKAFVRTYGFLSCLLPYGHGAWEKLAIFLNFLIPKLPAPREDDLSRGVLEAVDMDSYRPEVRAAMHLVLDDEEAEVEPVPTGGGGGRPEPEVERLSHILKSFNEQFGNIDWRDADKIRQVIAEEIPAKVAADKAYQNAIRNSDKENARVEHDKALQRVILELLSDHTELFKQFSDNAGFKRWLADAIFEATYQPSVRGALPKSWLGDAAGAIRQRFGDDAKWQAIVGAIYEYFVANAGEPMMLTDIERIGGELAVTVEDMVTVLQVLATDAVGLCEGGYSKADTVSGEIKEVSPSELRVGLAGWSAPGESGAHARNLADNVLVGWRPAVVHNNLRA